MMDLYEKIDEAEKELDQAKRDYLKHHGWQETCNTPGSFWVWQRDFADVDERRLKIHEARNLPSKPTPYGVITASMDSAISMTLQTLVEVS